MARMAGLIRPLAVRARGASARLEPSRPCAVTPMWKAGPRQGLPSFGGFQRGFSSSSAQVDPYKTLGLEKNASEAEVKKAYRDKALKWHPDRNEDNKEKAQEKFAECSSAYEILKDSEKRREYDTYGRVGGAQNGHPGGHPGGFGQHVSQDEANRMFREAFGQQGQGMEQIFQQMFQQQNMQRQQMGGFGGPQRQRGVLQAGMEVQVQSDVATIHSASRACGMDATNDERRARCAGKVGMITDVDPQDQSVKMRVMVTARGADEVWFGAGAVKLLEEEPQQQVNPGAGGPFAAGMGGFQQQQGFPGGGGGGGGCGGGRAPPKPEPKPEAVNGLHAGMEVQVQASAEAIHEASRACGIDADNDERRARCAGKIGTVVDVDSRDKSLKVRVMVKPGRADEVWFGARAVELLQEGPDASEADAQASASAM